MIEDDIPYWSSPILKNIKVLSSNPFFNGKAVPPKFIYDLRSKEEDYDRDVHPQKKKKKETREKNALQQLSRIK